MELEIQHRPGRYLAIQVAGKYYALLNDSVREIMPVPELFPPTLASLIEGARLARAGLAGFLHTQGGRVPVFDLHVRLGGAERVIRPSTQARMIVAEAHDLRFGFYADRMTDMIQARAHEIRRDSIVGHGRPKLILTLERLWTREELAELA